MEAKTTMRNISSINARYNSTYGFENPELRSENVKHFDLGRGCHQAVVYPEPVHYMDDDNSWKEIDNTLVEAIDARGRRILKNTGNRMHTLFNAGDSDAMPVAIEHNGVTFAWGLYNKAAAYIPAVRQGSELRREKLTLDTTTRCLSMPAGKFVNTAGTDGYCRQQVTIEKGRDYTMSCYMRLSSVTGSGAYLRITPVTSGAFTAKTSSYRNGSTTAAIGNGMGNDGWERFHFTFNIPGSGTVNAYFEMGTNATGGTAWFCCPQLEVGTIANPFNLVSNGDFHLSTASGSRSLPTDWTEGSNVLQNTSNGVISGSNDSTMPDHLSGNYVQLEGVPNKAYVCYTQQINMAGSAGDAVVLGGWAKGQAIPDSDSVTRGFGLAARIKKTDGTWSDYWFCPFNEEWTSWQYASFGAPCKYDYTMIEVGIVYNSNCNYAKFTNIFLHREEFGQTYTYDENKNPVSTRSLSSQQSNATYDSADNMTSYVQGGRDASVADNKYIFYYGGTDAEREKHLLLRSCTPMKQTDYFSYDGKGNRTSARRINYSVYSESTAEDAYPYIRTEATYTSDGNYPLTSKDARGNIVTRDTNAYDGTVTKVTDPTGQAVTYAYDASKRVTAVNAAADGKNYRNAYTYANDRITQVSHNTTGDTPDVTYSFAYDELGRKTTVKVGSQTLSTNTYENDRVGLLSSVTYGNGGKVSYRYDDFDRIAGISVDGSDIPCYTFEYGANGHAACVTDANLGRTLETEYDLADRPCRNTVKDNSGNVVYRSILCYDILSNPVQLREDVNGAHVTDFTYDRDNRVTNIGYGGNDKVKYTYDELGRVSSRTVENGTDAGRVATAYTFVSGGYGANSTTPLVQKISQPLIPFEYTYDNRGNIISEKRGSLTTTYAYDALGQLIRVNDPHENKTWIYEYDRGGNMTRRVQYAYTTGTLGSAVNTYTYSYNSQWKDQLVSSDGYPLTYDEIGNLKTYAGWVYEWDAGRRLVKQTQNEKVVAYDYDCNGMRIRQTVSAKTSGYIYAIYNYTYNGTKLVHMTVYNDDLHFFYDSQGRPAKVKYNGAMYTYLHNLQGDIVGIVDGSGALVVEYKYNAWGFILSRSGSMADTLGHRNPFRYRGYIYDEETWMYWLKSRYYYPELHRFISVDKILNNGLLSANIYAYCANSPVCKSDPSGNSWLSDIFHAANSFLRKYVDTADIGAFILNMKKDSKGVYHADYDCWQQYFGYNDLYDWAFNLGTSMLAKKFKFSSGSKDYIFWMWKGDYLNLGAGAELGIYTGGEPHWVVDKSLAMNMSMSLDLNGSNIASWSERHWWITSFIHRIRALMRLTLLLPLVSLLIQHKCIMILRKLPTNGIMTMVHLQQHTHIDWRNYEKTRYLHLSCH